MTENNLHDLFDQLEAEVEAASGDADEIKRRRIAAALEQARRQIASGAVDWQQEVVEEFEETIEEFEVSHPRLTTLLGEAIRMLGAAGI